MGCPARWLRAAVLVHPRSAQDAFWRPRSAAAWRAATCVCLCLPSPKETHCAVHSHPASAVAVHSQSTTRLAAWSLRHPPPARLGCVGRLLAAAAAANKAGEAGSRSSRQGGGTYSLASCICHGHARTSLAPNPMHTLTRIYRGGCAAAAEAAAAEEERRRRSRGLVWWRDLLVSRRGRGLPEGGGGRGRTGAARRPEIFVEHLCVKKKTSIARARA